jgi:hypothetical protein
MHVKVDIPPGTGKLDSWSIRPGGRWALVVWMEQAPRDRDNGVYWLWCAAWTHATHVQASSDPRDYDRRPRIWGRP